MFIHGEFVGGGTEVQQLHQEGKLTEMVKPNEEKDEHSEASEDSVASENKSD